MCNLPENYSPLSKTNKKTIKRGEQISWYQQISWPPPPLNSITTKKYKYKSGQIMQQNTAISAWKWHGFFSTKPDTILTGLGRGQGFSWPLFQWQSCCLISVTFLPSWSRELNRPDIHPRMLDLIFPGGNSQRRRHRLKGTKSISNNVS